MPWELAEIGSETAMRGVVSYKYCKHHLLLSPSACCEVSIAYFVSISRESMSVLVDAKKHDDERFYVQLHQYALVVCTVFVSHRLSGKIIDYHA